MKGTRGRAPSFNGLRPASEASSRSKRANRSSETRHERVLRSLLWSRGYRFRKDDRTLAGRPDVVFRRERVVVFCDGDFWHGRQWRRLSMKLRAGANAAYWIQKVRANMLRDRRNGRRLAREGWRVLRFWETDILGNPMTCAAVVERALRRASRAALQA